MLSFYSKNKNTVRPILLLTWLSLLPLALLTKEIVFFIFFAVLALGYRYFFGIIKDYFVATLKYFFGENVIQKIKDVRDDAMKKIDNFFTWAFYSVIFICIAMSTVGIVIWQIYYYLKNDVWYSISVIKGMQYFNVQWASNPTDWQGLWRVLDFMPLSLSIFIVVFLVLIGSENN